MVGGHRFARRSPFPVSGGHRPCHGSPSRAFGYCCSLSLSATSATPRSPPLVACFGHPRTTSPVHHWAPPRLQWLTRPDLPIFPAPSSLLISCAATMGLPPLILCSIPPTPSLFCVGGSFSCRAAKRCIVNCQHIQSEDQEKVDPTNHHNARRPTHEVRMSLL